MVSPKTPICLMILDGWGIGNPNDPMNAISRANTPNMDRLWAKYPHNILHTSGEAVGLPEGQMGNSEVGHLNIGAGRVVYQELTRITKAIRDGDFFKNPVLVALMDDLLERERPLHLMGLLSDGGVHSHNEHLYALLEMAKKKGLKEVWIHPFMDGRDVPPQSGAEFIEQLEAKIKEIGIGKIGTVCGRYYSMDRDRRWEREQLAYDAIAVAKGLHCADAVDAVKNSYAQGKWDEFVDPTVIDGYTGLAPDSGIIFFNFRPDRARQLTRIFSDFSCDIIDRGGDYIPVEMVTFTQYEAGLPVKVAFPPQTIADTLGEIFSRQGLKQLRIAETEKYAHVTFFFNGGDETPYPGEDRVLIPSPKVATYDLLPSMSAPLVTERLLEELKREEYSLVILNFANCDMVGHTGFFQAAEQAVETVDGCVGKITDALLAQGGIALITADHGNAEEMVDPNGGTWTAHTTNPVPLILVSKEYQGAKLAEGILADIAPTILDLSGLEIPPAMTGKSLIENRGGK